MTMTMTMQTEGPIRSRREGAILEVTLDRPKANAIDGDQPDHGADFPRLPRR
jgi:enoyl-CoA hydratase/carnithine racemase